jgi:hypothetical protein
MNYHDHNDAKGRDSRIRVQINRAERTRAAQPFEGTLCMSKYELQARCRESAYVGTSQENRS